VAETRTRPEHTLQGFATDRSVSKLVALLRTSVGRKLLMAVTGALLLGFLVVHLLGNLYLLKGREALNAYAAWLQGNPMLWPARIGLLAVFALHVAAGISLARENRAARPVGYRNGLALPVATLPSRSMLLTGLVVIAFVLFHLAHFTFGRVMPEAHALVDAQGRHDVYGMVLAGFQNPWIVSTYVVAMSLLGVHLAHAGQSFLQTLGIRYEHGNQLVKAVGFGLVAVIMLGNLVLPLSVFLGLAGPSASAALLVSRVAAGAP
jgi:succinate dehydrogenase / fumarate reductase, cytochrome b subunit